MRQRCSGPSNHVVCTRSSHQFIPSAIIYKLKVSIDLSLSSAAFSASSSFCSAVASLSWARSSSSSTSWILRFRAATSPSAWWQKRSEVIYILTRKTYVLIFFSYLQGFSMIACHFHTKFLFFTKHNQLRQKKHFCTLYDHHHPLWFKQRLASEQAQWCLCDISRL